MARYFLDVINSDSQLVHAYNPSFDPKSGNDAELLDRYSRRIFVKTTGFIDAEPNISLLTFTVRIFFFKERDYELIYPGRNGFRLGFVNKSDDIAEVHLLEDDFNGTYTALNNSGSKIDILTVDDPDNQGDKENISEFYISDM